MIIINKKYLYKKIFIFNNSSLLLENPELLLEYINEKANLLYVNHYNREEQLKVKIDIINEFEEIFKYDLDNAVIPEVIGIFDNESDKKRFIKEKLFINDFYSIIGNIFAGYIECLIRNNINLYDIDIPDTIVKYNELYKLGNNDLIFNISKEIELDKFKGTRYDFFISNNIPIIGTHAYLASYVYPTLIEYFLGINLRSKLLHNSIDKLKLLLDDGNIILNEREMYLYNTFIERSNKNLFENEKDYMKELYNMFIKYNVIDKDSDLEMILVGESKDNNKKLFRTIGGIINSSYSNNVIISEYMKLIRWLFDSNELNIRNNIMHGNNINFDYYGICFSCVMLVIIWDIADCSMFI